MTVLRFPLVQPAASPGAPDHHILSPVRRWLLRLRHWLLLRLGRRPLQAVSPRDAAQVVDANAHALERGLLQLNLDLERARR